MKKSENDNKNFNRVAVIGNEVAVKLFGNARKKA